MNSKGVLLLLLLTASTALIIIVLAYNKKSHIPAPVCPVCEKCIDWSEIERHIDTLTKQLGQELQPKVDEMGAGTALVGQYEKVTDAETDKVALQKYIKDCAKIPSAWFCFDTLADRIEVKKGTYSYFLMVNRLTSPELFALCNFMWSNMTMERWARHNDRACREFDKHYTEP